MPGHGQDRVRQPVVELDKMVHLHSFLLGPHKRIPSWLLSKLWGLRQGDPLSSYLFVIGMEALSCLINRAVEGNYLSGSRIANGRGEDLTISHLLYADDTPLFCEADKDS